MVQLCRDNDIKHQKDVFRFYRSGAAAAGADVRAALTTFGIDASHGYERIHMRAHRSVGDLCTSYALSPVEIQRDAKEFSGLKGFTTQPLEDADRELTPETDDSGPGSPV
ncbi:hypothetical protein [Labrenzia sp. VG12]|uniref:hypothetical protein n=1 Tax=Labrenzia sp. VG12 TaxID=2021862 RepID=UPI00352CE502